MAAVTSAGVTWDTNSGTKQVVATPSVGDLIVIVSAHATNTSDTAPTDNNADGNGTYTAAETRVFAGSANKMKIWIRDDLIGSATSTTFTIAPGTSDGGGLAVLKVSGMTKVGSAAKAKSGGTDNQGATTASVSWTGGGAASGTNPLVGAVFMADSTPDITKPASFDSELHKVGHTAPTRGLHVVSDNTGNTDSTVTWAAGPAANHCAAILELDASAAATGRPGDLPLLGVSY